MLGQLSSPDIIYCVTTGFYRVVYYDTFLTLENGCTADAMAPYDSSNLGDTNCNDGLNIWQCKYDMGDCCLKKVNYLVSV